MDTIQDTEVKGYSGGINFVAGGVAGIVTDAALFPLDFIKTRMQAKRTRTFIKGFSDLYCGFGPAILGSFPSSAVYFYTYCKLKEIIRVHDVEHKCPEFLRYSISAACGEVVGCAIRIPFELVKQRMQVGLHTNGLQAVADIIKVSGVRGLFAGYLSTVVREVPFDAFQFSLWEKFKKDYAAYAGIPVHQVSPLASATCGSVAGGIAAYVTTPVDVAKTRLMTQCQIKKDYHGLTACLLEIGRTEGIRGLFSGAISRVSWVTIGGFFYFGCFEATAKAISKFA